ncbi:MAG TPA: glycosyltransferase family 4 protein [Cyclobacteriaceae bacterium]|nr:glycosyltransferase family 4 protein [Cyclobacteriaceae bacterium]
MKILLLHQFFKTPETGGAIRSYYLSQALKDSGHTVVVISSHNKTKYAIENIDGVEVHYLPIAYDNRFSFFKRAWAFLRYVFIAAKLSGKFHDFDRCYAISVPLTVGIIARWNKFRYGLPYIFEVGDLWPDAPIQMGYISNYFFKRFLFALEKSIYRHAELIVALSKPIQEAIEEKVPGKQLECIPNMADCDYYFPAKKNPALEEKYCVNEKFVVTYAGALGAANGLNFLLACAAVSKNEKLPIHFLICGDGAIRENLIAKTSALALQNVSILPFINREGVKEIMNVTDAAFISFENVPILETGSPNKYFDGLAAGKLIITNFGGWIKNEIEEAGCGISINPLMAHEFVEKIHPFLSDRQRLNQYQNASRALAETKYSRKLLSGKFVKLF